MKKLSSILLTILVLGCSSTKPFYPKVGMTFDQVDTLSVKSLNGHLPTTGYKGQYKVYTTYWGSEPNREDSIGSLKSYYFKNGILVDPVGIEKELHKIYIDSIQERNDAIDKKEEESELRYAALEKLRVAEQKRIDEETAKAKAEEVAAEAAREKEKVATETAREKERTRCLYDTDIGVCNGGNFANGSDQLMYAERLGFGGMLTSQSLDQIGKNIVQLTVRNNTSSDVKDITFSCDSIATSGTVLDSEDLTIFQVFPKNIPLSLNLKIMEVEQTNSIKCRAKNYRRI